MQRKGRNSGKMTQARDYVESIGPKGKDAVV